jgi:hypothetical protein
VPDDVAAWARAHKFDPTVARGDFDGDGRADVAFLVQARSQPLREYPERLVASRLAVCLARPSGVVLHLLDQLYCGDYIEAVAKGERYYDFERDRKGVYPSDGVKTVCFEHASATYVYDGGGFRRIVDGD